MVPKIGESGKILGLKLSNLRPKLYAKFKKKIIVSFSRNIQKYHFRAKKWPKRAQKWQFIQWNEIFLKIKWINALQWSIPKFALTIKQIQWSVPEINVNDRILGPKMEHFTLSKHFKKIFFSQYLFTLKV